jgi:hypothetical protein
MQPSCCCLHQLRCCKSIQHRESTCSNAREPSSCSVRDGRSKVKRSNDRNDFTKHSRLNVTKCFKHDSTIYTFMMRADLIWFDKLYKQLTSLTHTKYHTVFRHNGALVNVSSLYPVVLNVKYSQTNSTISSIKTRDTACLTLHYTHEPLQLP